MEERRLLNTFTARNISNEDLAFEMQLSNGLYVEQVFEAGEIVKGLTRHARSLLWPWYEKGLITFTQEFEIVDLRPNWRLEGF